MNRPTGIRRTWAGAAVLTCAAVLTAVLAGPALAVTRPAGDEDDGTTLTVEVTDGSPTPSPTHPSGPPFPPPGPPTTIPPGRGAGNGPPAGSGAASTNQATILDEASADAALGDDATTSGGILTMSGITASISPALGVGNGSLTLDVVVRNTSRSAFDSTARFRLDDALGNLVADPDAIEVTGLEPGETRRVAVAIDGPGQHPVLRASVTLTPPDVVDGVPASPLTRTAVIALPPLFTAALVGGLAALGAVSWWVFSARGLGVRWRWAGA